MVCPGRGASAWVAAAGALFYFCPGLLAQGIVSRNAPAIPRPKASGRPFNAKFVDVARDAGLTARFVQGHPEKKRYIVEANGTGVAFIDFDRDGLLDVFLVNGSRFEPGGPAATNRLYRNLGEGRFGDVTARSGVGRSGWGNGVCAGDYDNDGNTDLYVTYWGLNSLFRNKGSGRFDDVAAQAGVAGRKEQWSTGCTFLDYDRDGHLDLFVATYVAFDPARTPLPGAAPHCVFRDRPVFCGPRGLPHGSVTLYRNRRDGTFEDVSLRAGVRAAPPCYAFTTVAADLNGDGWIDIYVACDSTPSLYFRNNRDGTFRELGTEAGVAYSEHGAEQAGMGAAVADYNNDGTLDITKTNFIRDYPNLYRNLGKGAFEDAAVAAGLGVNPQYVLWGTALEDFDNDGLRDVFQVSGHVFTDIPGEPWAGPRLLYRNLGAGRFEDVSDAAGLSSAHPSRGAAFGDYDNDGDMDVLVMNMDAPPSLLRNDLNPRGNWLQVRLRGTKSNRDAIGSVVTLHAGGVVQSAPVLSQSSYLSVNDLRLHFGLGKAAEVDRVEVQWPSGERQEFRGIAVNSAVELVERE
jgi:enediyne biosynthesis protein E4